MNSHLKGLIVTTLGVLFIVPDSLFVRLIDAEPMVTAFWRGMISGLIILLAVSALQGLNGFLAVLRTGRAGAVYMLLIALTTPGFVLAITNTSVANVVFISRPRRSSPRYTAGPFSASPSACAWCSPCSRC